MTSSTNRRVLANCDDYNGHKNTLFMMRPDDFRLTTEKPSGGTWGYTIVAHGRASDRNRLLTLDDGTEYTVHGDWSVTKGRARRVTMADHRAMERS